MNAGFGVRTMKTGLGVMTVKAGLGVMAVKAGLDENRFCSDDNESRPLVCET